MSSPSKSEQVAETRGQLTLPPQVSGDFAIDHAPPDFDPSATLLNVVPSSAGGYLLTYDVPHARPRWVPTVVAGQTPDDDSAEIVFLHWDGLAGAPTTLARIPIAMQPFGSRYSAYAVDVGSAWLVVYSGIDDGIWKDRVVTLGHDGQLGVPVELPPSTCGGTNSIAGLARGGSSVLLTYPCGVGLLLDLAGGVLKSLTIATAESFGSPPKGIPYTPYGGQVAFNGIDYLVLYAFFTTPYSQPLSGKQVLGFPITPAGDVRSPITISEPPPGNASNYSRAAGLVANGSTFLALVSRVRLSIGANDFSYSTVTETSDHTFTLSAERYLPGSPHSGTTDDRFATPLVLNDHFAIARLPGSPDSIMELISPSSNPAIPDVVQQLPSGLGWASSLTSSDGKHLLVTSNARGVRFDEALHAVDNPPAALIPTPHGQFMPFFTATGARYLATWTEAVPDGFGSANAQIFAQRVSSTSTLLDSASLQLTPAAGGRDALLTTNSSWSAVLWDLGRGVKLTTADPPAVTPIPVESFPSHVWSIGTDGVHLAMAAENHYDISLVQLGNDDTWSGVTVAEGIADATTTAPALAFNAGNYAVLWTVAGAAGERIVYGARVTPGLELLDDPPKDLLHFSSPDVPEYGGHTADGGLELIASGDHFLLAWATVIGNTEQLRVARLSSTLAVLDPSGVLVATQPFPQIGLVTRRVALGWDGNYDWVVWTDGEGGVRSPFASLRGRRFSADLTPADPEPFLIASDLDEVSKVTLAVGPAGRGLVGYTRYLPSDHSYRVRARLLASTPFEDGVPCNNASQCQNGFCVANVCSATGGSGGAAGGGNGGFGGLVGGNTAGITDGGFGGAVGGTGGITDGGFGGAVGGDTGGTTDGGFSGTVGGHAGEGEATAGKSGSGGTVAAAGTGAVVGGAGGADPVVDGGEGGSQISAGGEDSGNAGANDGGRAGSTSGASGASTGHAGVAGTPGGGGSKDHSCSITVVGADATGKNLVSFAALVSALCWLRRRRYLGVA